MKEKCQYHYVVRLDLKERLQKLELNQFAKNQKRNNQNLTQG